MNQHKHSRALAQRARTLLEEKNIEGILSRYGQVVYTGSYPADLMVWPDIDIQVVMPDNVLKLDSIIEISRIFLEDPEIENVKLINFSKTKKPGMPEGIYMGMKIKPRGDNIAWKLDIWALEEKDYRSDLEFHQQVISRLTPQLRELILEWKYRLMGNNDRVPHLGSYSLYQAILFKKLVTEKEILNYLAEAGLKFDHD